jgi:FG-GAP-like repeat
MISSRHVLAGRMSRSTHLRGIPAVLCLTAVVGCGQGTSRTSGSGGNSGAAGSAAGSGGVGGGVGSTGAGGTVSFGGLSGRAGAGAGGAGGGPGGAGNILGSAGGGAGRAGSGGGLASGGGGGRGGSGTGGAGGAGAVCSEMPMRTAPPAGKEAFRYAPIDARFPFAGHWMGVFSADPRFIGEISLADFDNDGDLDFASGQGGNLPGLMIWWEYCGPDHWVPHVAGRGFTSWAGGSAADFDGDGWIDLIAGNFWYRNPRTPRTSMWQGFPTGGPRPEEILVGDVNGDGKPDALFVHLSFVPQFWSPGATPTATWIRGPLLANPQQQGGAIGDIDGDGANDILVGYRWWYRNVNRDGSTWQTVNIFPSGFDDSPLTALGDLDGDGDTDFVMGTHFGTRVAWAENQNGVGTQFAMHTLPNAGLTFIHTVWAADFDNDGDLDLLIANNVGPMFIYENTDGRGAFVQHMIAANTRGHEARVADVDCDGDLDIAGTPWGDPTEGGEQLMPPRDHIYLQNMLVESGGTPRFNRQPYEVFQAAVPRVCNQ